MANRPATVNASRKRVSSKAKKAGASLTVKEVESDVLDENATFGHGDIPEHAEKETHTQDDFKSFEFVTVTGQPSPNSRFETSKRVRTQAMRDYLRKQNRQATAGIVEVIAGANPEQPSVYKGKFKLNSWSHKTKSKSMKARHARQVEGEVPDAGEEVVEEAGTSSTKVSRQPSEAWQLRRSPQPYSELITTRVSLLDPFNSLSIELRPLSDRLLVHYHNSYSMNSVAINPGGDFFSHAQRDSAMLHAIFYLVALHQDLKYGIQDSPACLHHGGQAFRIIHERLEGAVFKYSDTTLAAVAMLVNKENLNGKYELSKIHMQGLEHMVRLRGGIKAVNGVFQRIVTWSDFCYATVWNCQPYFPRLTLPFEILDTILPLEPSTLRPSHIFGSASPMVTIFNLLRILSHDLSPAYIAITNLFRASATIYNLEYELLLLNKVHADDPEPTERIFSFEAVPLKIAAHLYLWLVIRELPPTSELLYLLVQRLQDLLEIQIPGWWSAGSERITWLLWMLFVGGAASAKRMERWWFVRELSKVFEMLGIDSFETLRAELDKVLWQEAWCKDHCLALWADVKVLEEMGRGDPDSSAAQSPLNF